MIRDATAKTKSKKKRPAAPRKPQLPDRLDLVMQLMAIPGKSGEEQEVVNFITKHLRAAGISSSEIKFDTAHRKTPIDGNVGNMVVKLPGTIRGPRRLLMAHMDTVPLCQGSRPVRKGNYVRSADPKTALGADDRAGVAVTLHTLLRVLREKVEHPPLTFLWTVQEEIGLHGARHLRLGLLGKPQLAFNWDGGSCDRIHIGATGGYKLHLDVHGIASHAGNHPERGVSAIAIASTAIADLQANGWHGRIEKNGKLGTSNVGIFQGGAATNVVTDHATVTAEARSHNATFRKRIVAEIEQAFHRAAKKIQNADGQTGRVHIERHLNYDAFKLKPNEPSVKAAEAAVRKSGRDPELHVVNGGLDANWMSAHGLPTVTLGCGQTNPHMVTEALDVREFITACDIGFCLATAGEARDTAED